MFPKLISIGSFFLPTYGVLVASVFWLGCGSRCGSRSARLPPRRHESGDLLRAGRPGGREAVHVSVRLPRISGSDPKIDLQLATLQAAGVYQGGLLLALVMAIYYMRKTQLPVLETFDVFAPGIAWAMRSGGWAASRRVAAGAPSAICPGPSRSAIRRRTIWSAFR